MTYTYAYKTSDGTRHEDAMEASSREEVFVALRAKGIRPIKVVAADGSKANGASVGTAGGGTPALPNAARTAQGTKHKAQGTKHKAQSTKHKALIPLILIGLVGLALVGAVLFFALKETSSSRALLADTTRRQVIGDAFLVEKGLRTGWADVFAHEGERFLASFAIPGVEAVQRTSTEAELRAALERKIPPSAADSLEVQQIKAMVEGMKDELRRFVAAGGTIAEYGRRLVQRQEEELKYYNLVKGELEAAAAAQMPPHELFDLWERRNEDLRQMGIRLVPMPEQQ